MAKNDHFQLVPNKKAKSDVWGHFWIKMNRQTQKHVENVASYRHCDRSVKYRKGTTNLLSHLNRHHPSATLKTKVKVEETHENPVTIPTPSLKPTEVKKVQPTLTGMLSAASKYPFHSVCASATTRSIAHYIIDDLRPLSVVEGNGFQNMIRTFDPRYNLPGRTYFSKTLIPQMYSLSRLSKLVCLRQV